MAGTGNNYDKTVQQVLESANNPSRQATKLREEWSDKSPQEAAAASRKVFYGIVTPSLQQGEPLSEDAIQQIEALFETTFSHVEKSSMSRSGSRSGN